MTKCIKCGRRVCKDKARFYAAPLNQLCVEHLKEELLKLGKEDKEEK